MVAVFGPLGRLLRWHLFNLCGKATTGPPIEFDSTGAIGV